MKKLLLSIFGLVLALTVGAQNLVTNGGFEDGTRAGWNTWNNGIQQTDVYEGLWAGELKVDLAASFLIADFTVVPGKTYDISFYAKWPNGIGTSEGVDMVLQTPAPEKAGIGGTAKITSTDWSQESAQVTIPDGLTSVRVSIFKAISPVCYIDNVVITEVVGTNPTPDVTLSDDGEILEDLEDGEVITVGMTVDTFVDPLVPENWTVSNMPEGITLGAITRVGDTEVTMSLLGNTTGDYDTDITNLTVDIAAAEFTNYEFPVTVNTGVTFIAAVEGGEVVVWEEDFSTFTPDVVLDSTYLASKGFLTQGAPDSVKVIDGYGVMYTSEAEGKNNWVKTTMELIPGMTYIYSLDLKTPDGGKTFGVVWRARTDQYKTTAVQSTEWQSSFVQFLVEADRDTVDLGVYRWGFPKETHFDNMKLVMITEPMIEVSNDGEILEGAEDGEVITVKALYDTFVATPDLANWSADTLPEGVSLGSLNRVDDTTIEITLSGNTSGFDADIVASITATSDEFVTSNKGLTAGGLTFTAEIIAPETASITFIVDDTKLASATRFAIKGSWNTATGEYDAEWNGGDEHSDFFDDGTNGDVTAGDHIWTVTLEFVPDGGTNTFEWGVNDSEGNWLDGNFQFTLTDAADQTLDTYVILNNDASLSTLSLDVGTLDPAFDAGTTSYTAEVPTGTTSVTVSGTVSDVAATISGDGAIDVSSGSGTANIVVTAENGSTSVTYTIDITVLVGIELSMMDMIEVYPNPVTDRLNITSESTIESVWVYDLLGSKLFEMSQINATHVELSTESWNSGIYIVNITDNQGRNSISKIVK